MVEQTNVVPLVVNKYQKTNLTLKHGDMVWEVVFVYLDGGRLVLVWFLIKCLETSPSRLPPPPHPPTTPPHQNVCTLLCRASDLI